MKTGVFAKIMAGICFGLLIVASINADENNSRAGTRAFDFLKIQMGARPMAMGGAFTGVADDATALYYNPSGIANLTGKQYIAGYHNNIFDMQSGFVGFIAPVGEERKAFAYINYLNYGDFIKTDELGNEDGTFSGGDLVFAGGYSMALTYQLFIGGTAKFIYEKIDEYTSTGMAVDIGLKYQTYDGRTSFGLMLQNLGTQLGTFVDGGEKYPLPTYLKAGAASRLKGLPLLIAGDVIYPTDNDIFIALGAELLNLQPLYVRLGWTNFGSNYKTGGSGDDWAGLSAGFGFEFNKMQISYTVTPQAELGTSHRITFTGGIY